MARRSRSQSSSPNKVLVIFLIIFILTNIGLGVWVWYGYNQRDKIAKSWEDKEKAIDELKQTSEFYKYQRNELMAAIGMSDASKGGFITELKKDREPFMEQKRFKGEDGAPEFRDAVKDLEGKLGGFDKETGYRSKFADLPGPLEEKLRKALKDFAAEKANVQKKEELLAALEKKYAANRTEVVSANQAASDAAMKQLQKTSEATTQAFNLINDLEKKLADREAEYSKELAQKTLDIKVLQQKFKKEEILNQLPNRSAGAVRSLMLDVSKAKTLWDSPRGKIVRIDDSGKRVFIDKGSKDGVKPGLTFMVFAANWNGRGEGGLKATIEVIRVEDANSSLCKINTYYDGEGHEISITDATPSKILRDGPGALRAGDLLFNLFWGAHVAIGGIIDFDGGATTPAAQWDALSSFMQHLQRMGVTVDAYTDLRDGSVVGEVTNQTQVAIRGANAAQPAPPAPPDPRAKAINDNSRFLTEAAADRGMFIISANNFAVVTGYRRLAGNGIPQPLTFVPSRPGGDLGLPEDAPKK